MGQGRTVEDDRDRVLVDPLEHLLWCNDHPALESDSLTLSYQLEMLPCEGEQQSETREKEREKERKKERRIV